ncbi:MAG: hypothetical protein V4675_05165 [Verrucomicrobiota bacterium]
MKLPSIRLALKMALPFLFGAVNAPAALQSAPMGFYSVEMKKGDQAVGVSLVNPALFSGTITTASGNRLATAALALDAGGLLTTGKAYYIEIVAGPADALVGQRLEVDVTATQAATTPNGEIVVTPTSKRSTTASLAGLTGYQLELREHLTLNQVFPKDKLYGSTSFSDADQVQFFDGNGFEICYVYGRDGQAQWTALKGFASQDGRVILPGEGLIFKRSNKSPGPVTLRISGVARTTTFVQPLVSGYNYVSSGFPVDGSFADRQAWPLTFQNGDRVKIYQSGGFVTYRLYSQGTSPSANLWATLGDSSYTSMNDRPLFGHRSAAFLQLKTAAAGYRYAPPFQP